MELNRLGFPRRWILIYISGDSEARATRKAYSQDLRERALAAVEKEGMSCRAAARRYNVSASTAIKWLAAYRRVVQRPPSQVRGHRPSALIADLARASSFYETGLGWKASPASQGDVVFFQTSALAIALFPRPSLAEDA